ncbi:MAG: hypothetical protein ACP5KS_10450, partial [Candidatus Hydrogenedens sp.]
TFILSNGDFFYSYTVPTNTIFSIETQKKREISNPKNFLENLIVNYYQYKREDEFIQYYDYMSYEYYFYEGKLSIRQIFFTGDKKRVYALPSNIGIGELIIYGDPRILWGGMRYTYDELRQSPIPLYKFFQKKGTYYYNESGEYKILWHQISSEDNEYTDKFLEVWVDNDENIARLRKVDYFGRSHSVDDIKKAEKIIGTRINCNFPEVLIEDIIFSDFYSQYKIPLRMEQRRYSPICKDTNIYKGLREKKLSFSEYQAKLALCPWEKTTEIILLVERGNFRINEPVDKKYFNPTIPDKTMGTEESNEPSKKGIMDTVKYYKKYLWVWFVLGSIIFILILLKITNIFLGT